MESPPDYNGLRKKSSLSIWSNASSRFAKYYIILSNLLLWAPTEHVVRLQVPLCWYSCSWMIIFYVAGAWGGIIQTVGPVLRTIIIFYTFMHWYLLRKAEIRHLYLRIFFRESSKRITEICWAISLTIMNKLSYCLPKVENLTITECILFLVAILECAWAWGYKTVFILNSIEHEFILLINIKIPIIFNIFPAEQSWAWNLAC